MSIRDFFKKNKKKNCNVSKLLTDTDTYILIQLYLRFAEDVIIAILYTINLFIYLHYLVKSSEGFFLSFIVWLTLMTDGTALLGCCHNNYFTNPILIHMFSFASVYINLRQNRQCLWGYFPGWPFWHNFVCTLPALIYARLHGCAGSSFPEQNHTANPNCMLIVNHLWW